MLEERENDGLFRTCACALFLQKADECAGGGGEAGAHFGGGQSGADSKKLTAIPPVFTGEPEAVAKVHEITPCIFGADCFLMVAAVPSEGWVREFDRKNFAEIDAAIVATHIMLAIEAEGLGSTWVGHFDAPRAKELFPEMAPYELIALFPIGEKAAEAHPAHLHEKRVPISERLERL